MLAGGIPGRRDFVTALGSHVRVEWRPEEARLVLSTDPEPAQWSVRGEPPPALGAVRWGGPLLGPEVIPRLRWSDSLRKARGEQLRNVGWVPAGAGFTATWAVRASSVPQDAREAATLVMNALEYVYHTTFASPLLAVYDPQ